jgi:putative Mg2+ transporter-C (MgtC) family protein
MPLMDTLLQNISWLEPTTITFIIDLLIAVALGILIGGERELRGKDAGISTHTLVISGAMLFTFMSMTVDPASESRIAAQIVTGIGFLGAGLIIKDGDTVRNLTTAASIWFAGSIGMAIGFGFYQIAIVAGIASVFIPRIPDIRPKHKKVYMSHPQTKEEEKPIDIPITD